MDKRGHAFLTLPGRITNFYQEELSVLLSSDLALHQPIPKEYILDVKDENVNNTFVFTEQDLPGFKSKSQAKFDLSSANMPARLTKSKIDRPKQPYDQNKRFEPYFRKAIPSEFEGSVECGTLLI